MSTDRQYHALVRGKQQGPLTREQMIDLASRGEIGPDTMAWTDGMTIWRPLPEVPGLDSLLADLPEQPTRAAPESLLPDSVDAALDKVSRSQAFIIGAGIFFGLIGILGIGNIVRFRELAFLGFWGSAALAYFAYQAYQQEEAGQYADAATTTYRGAIGAWILAVVSFAFGNFFFGALQAGAGVLFWMARADLQKQEPEQLADASLPLAADGDLDQGEVVGDSPAMNDAELDGEVPEA